MASPSPGYLLPDRVVMIFWIVVFNACAEAGPGICQQTLDVDDQCLFPASMLPWLFYTISIALHSTIRTTPVDVLVSTSRTFTSSRSLALMDLGDRCCRRRSSRRRPLGSGKYHSLGVLWKHFVAGGGTLLLWIEDLHKPLGT